MRINKRNKLFYSGLAAAGIFLISTAFLFSAKKNRDILIMTYNLENLFDAIHDEGKNDYTYLPLEFKKRNKTLLEKNCPSNPNWRKSCLEMDWSEKRLKDKIDRLTRSILKNSQGQCPDILLVQEVENQRVLQRLMQNLNAQKIQHKYLHAVLVEGEDERGIDTGILSKLPLYRDVKEESQNPILHKLRLDNNLTRGILQADFLLPSGEKISVLNFHFPSQMNPWEDRVKGLEAMNRIAEEILEKNPRGLIIAGGDSNVITTELPRMREITKEHWAVSADYIIRMEKKVGGTHNYHGEWSMLDLFFLHRRWVDSFGDASYIPDGKSFAVATVCKLQKVKNKKGQIVPERYSHPDYSGVSDHFPVKFILKAKN